MVWRGFTILGLNLHVSHMVLKYVFLCVYVVCVRCVFPVGFRFTI